MAMRRCASPVRVADLSKFSRIRIIVPFIHTDRRLSIFVASCCHRANDSVLRCVTQPVVRYGIATEACNHDFEAHAGDERQL